MNARLLPEVLTLREPSPQQALPLAADGVQRYVWESRFGAILLEVRDGETYVDGQWVQPAERPSADPAR